MIELGSPAVSRWPVISHVEFNGGPTDGHGAAGETEGGDGAAGGDGRDGGHREGVIDAEFEEGK